MPSTIKHYCKHCNNSISLFNVVLFDNKHSNIWDFFVNIRWAIVPLDSYSIVEFLKSEHARSTSYCWGPDEAIWHPRKVAPALVIHRQLLTAINWSLVSCRYIGSRSSNSTTEGTETAPNWVLRNARGQTLSNWHWAAGTDKLLILTTFS